MIKYHVNPEGNPGACSAQPGNCPYGGELDHYGSEDAARMAYERKMAASLFAPAGLSEEEKNAKARQLVESHPLMGDYRVDRDLDGRYFWELQEVAEKGLAQYSEEDREAIKTYAGYKYWEINEAFWEKDPSRLVSGPGEGGPSKLEIAMRLDKILADAKFDEPQVVYRGIKPPAADDLKSKLGSWHQGVEIGEVLEFPSYTSTSYNMDTGRYFAGRGVNFEMLTKQGLAIGTMETEVLLKRDTRWRVADKKRVRYKDEYYEVVQLVDEDLIS